MFSRVRGRGKGYREGECVCVREREREITCDQFLIHTKPPNGGPCRGPKSGLNRERACMSKENEKGVRAAVGERQ